MKKVALALLAAFTVAGCVNQSTQTQTKTPFDVSNSQKLYDINVATFNVYSNGGKQPESSNVQYTVPYIDINTSSSEDIVRKVATNTTANDYVYFSNNANVSYVIGAASGVKVTKETPYVSSTEVYYKDNKRIEEKRFSNVTEGAVYMFNVKESKATQQPGVYDFEYDIKNNVLISIKKLKEIEVPYVATYNDKNVVGGIPYRFTKFIRHVANGNVTINGKSYNTIETYNVISVNIK